MGAPKGNKNALGNDGGRPPFFESNEQLQQAIDSYFENCPDKRMMVVGEGSIEIPIYTITGLAYHLGFESRQSFYDYIEKIEFTYTIKRARLKIESKYEQNLQFNNATGSIFALKNFGWVDKTEHEVSGGISLHFDHDDALA